MAKVVAVAAVVPTVGLQPQVAVVILITVVLVVLATAAAGAVRRDRQVRQTVGWGQPAVVAAVHTVPAVAHMATAVKVAPIPLLGRPMEQVAVVVAAADGTIASTADRVARVVVMVAVAAVAVTAAAGPKGLAVQVLKASSSSRRFPRSNDWIKTTALGLVIK